MPQPTAKNVHEDELLTDFSLAYKADAKDFIFDKVFPFMPSSKQSDKYRTYTKNDWFRDEAKILAPGAEPVITGYNVSTDTFYCDVWSIGHDVDEQVEANDDLGRTMRDATEFLTQLMMIRLERQFHADFFTTSVWGTDATPGVLWSTGATSDPQSDVETAKRTVKISTGFKPNKMVVGYDTHKALLVHPLIREQYKHTTSDKINTNMLASYFDVEQYLVSQATYATNLEGATAAMDFVGGKHALLVYSPPRASMMAPTSGLVVGWAGLTGLNNAGMRVLNIDNPLAHSKRVEVQAALDFKRVAADLGYFFNGAVA
jgi:hypothetical protein